MNAWIKKNIDQLLAAVLVVGLLAAVLISIEPVRTMAEAPATQWLADLNRGSSNDSEIPMRADLAFGTPEHLRLLQQLHTVKRRVEFHGKVMVCSEPRNIGQETNFEAFSQRLESVLRQRKEYAVRRDSLENLSQSLIRISERRKELSQVQRKAAIDQLASRHPIERVAFFASIAFGLQLFVVTDRE